MSKNCLFIPSYVLPAIAVIASIPVITQPAFADTVSFTFLQSFGVDNGTYKVMVQSQSGRRYFVWYWNSIGVEKGAEVLIEIDWRNNWTDISNPANGRTSNIRKVEEVT